MKWVGLAHGMINNSMSGSKRTATMPAGTVSQGAHRSSQRARCAQLTAPHAAYHFLLTKLFKNTGHLVNVENEAITIEMVNAKFGVYTPTPTIDGGQVLAMTDA